MPKIEIMPSILAADMGNLEAALRQCEQAGADLIHMDIMDGVFVPNVSMGSAVVEMAHRVTPVPMHVHLMMIQPQNHIDAFVRAGAETILIHIEADCPIETTLAKIRSHGVKSGITVNPPTAIESIFPCLENGWVDEVLIMTVNPGFGGQKYMADAAAKAAAVRRRFPDIQISIDGGIDSSTVSSAAAYGANRFVAGTFLFKAPDMKAAICQLREKAEASYGSNIA